MPALLIVTTEKLYHLSLSRQYSCKYDGSYCVWTVNSSESQSLVRCNSTRRHHITAS